LAGHLSDLLVKHGYHWLDPAELLAIDDHLAFCASCRELLCAAAQSQRALLALHASLAAAKGDDDHPAHDDVQGYLDGRLDEVDRELVQVHFESCTLCRTQAARLCPSALRSDKARSGEF
jgi:predicted anti-sigma-YlaC factor YlaD